MRINPNLNTNQSLPKKSNSFTNSSKKEQAIRDKTQTLNAKEITNSYFLQFTKKSLENTKNEFNLLSALFKSSDGKTGKDLMSILKKAGLENSGFSKNDIDSISKQDVKSLLGKDGFFGIDKTSQRIADFIIKGAGNDMQKLKAGKEGMLRGFKEAEKLWGSKLPEISQQTMDKSIQMVEKRISELGGSNLSLSV